MEQEESAVHSGGDPHRAALQGSCLECGCNVAIKCSGRTVLHMDGQACCSPGQPLCRKRCSRSWVQGPGGCSRMAKALPCASKFVGKFYCTREHKNSNEARLGREGRGHGLKCVPLQPGRAHIHLFVLCNQQLPIKDCFTASTPMCE